MIDAEQLKAFWKRWGYEPGEEVEFRRFITRLDELLESVWNEYIRNYSAQRHKFAFISGTKTLDSTYNGYEFTAICDTLKKHLPLPQVIEMVQFVLWTLQPSAASHVCNRLNRVFNASPNLQVKAVFERDRALLIPMGAELLDKEVIEGNLAWLENYPQAAKPFAEALKIYMGKDPNQYRSMLDNLRFSVEEMLRAVLKNQKSLENQKEQFLCWVKDHGAHSQISGLYHDLLFGRFAQYQNDAVKHHEDDYTPAEVEFLLYWTGTLLRFVQRVSEPASGISET